MHRNNNHSVVGSLNHSLTLSALLSPFCATKPTKPKPNATLQFVLLLLLLLLLLRTFVQSPLGRCVALLFV